MPRKPNYDFEKRQKELARQAKKEAKRQERQQRKDAPSVGGSDASHDETPGNEPLRDR